MQYYMIEWDHEEEDEPWRLYLELDSRGCPRRKVEVFRVGLYQSYDDLDEPPTDPRQAAGSEGNVTAGYANGVSAEKANYEAVCSGVTGFRETVRVEYDPEQISLEHLLLVFFAVIDPETPNRQGPDFGSQYQAGVYWVDEADDRVIRQIAALEASAAPRFAVELKPLENFYPAEEYHQRYLEKHPGGYCHISPLRIRALERFPFRELTYDTPAKELLEPYLNT